MSGANNLLSSKDGAITTSADCEVQKLKDLVKKLERQNQHLRYKTGKLSPYSKTDTAANSNDKFRAYSSVLQHGSDEEHLVPQSDMEKWDMDDDTSWLYVSPKQRTREDRHSLEIWLRGELDHPSTPQLMSAKKSIIDTLEQPSGYGLFKNEPHVHEAASPYLTTSSKLAHIEDMNPKSSCLETNARPHQTIAQRLFPKDEEDNPGKYHPYKHVNDSNESALTGIHQVHHMPLPSHTMTSAHGLVPSSSVSRNRQRSSSPQSRTTKNASDYDSGQKYAGRHRSPISSRRESPTRGVMRTSLSEKTSIANRSHSPASHSRSTRSLSDIQRGRSSSPRTDTNFSPTDQTSRQKSGLSRLRMPSGLHRSSSPVYGASSASDISKQRIGGARQIKPPARTARVNKGSYSEPNSQSSSISQPTNNVTRCLTPRRSLPRPSQSSTNQFQNQNSKYTEVVKTSTTSPNITGEQHKHEFYSSPCGSESGSSDVWKDGEFF